MKTLGGKAYLAIHIHVAKNSLLRTVTHENSDTVPITGLQMSRFQ